MPWIYYLQETASTVLMQSSIPTQFAFPSSKLNFKLGAYNINGTFLGYYNVSDGFLQLCKNTPDYLGAAWVFGTYYSQSVGSGGNDEFILKNLHFDFLLLLED